MSMLDHWEGDNFGIFWFMNGGMIHADWKYRRYSNIRHAAETLPKKAWDKQQIKIKALIELIRKKDEKFLEIINSKSADDGSKHIEAEIDWGLRDAFVSHLKEVAELGIALTTALSDGTESLGEVK